MAGGLATATLGTDAVASIRFPAAWCGVVGFKPTWGMVSRAGVFPVAMPAAARARLLAGEWDSLGQLLSAEAEIHRVCDALPYVRGF